MSPPTNCNLLGKITPLPTPLHAKSLQFTALKASFLLPPFILFIYSLEDAGNVERLLRAQDAVWIWLGGTPVLSKHEYTSTSQTRTEHVSQGPRVSAVRAPAEGTPCSLILQSCPSNAKAVKSLHSIDCLSSAPFLLFWEDYPLTSQSFT